MFWGFLWHGTYYVVVKEGSHFCQSPKGGDQDFFFLTKMQGRANTFWEKIPKFPRKNVLSPIDVSNVYIKSVINT